ncbi:MAG: aldose 1-epimerase [Dehalococcoidales bacterium]|nr:aldose 1-epimerase [Dehalococcoidales bacterium]
MSVGSRYAVSPEKDPVFNEDAYVLKDHLAGSSATIIPSLGNNLMSFVVSPDEGSPLEVMMGAPAGESIERASRWGNPILFPFPNRVRNACYSFEGHEYRLDVNTPDGHHLHGLVRDLPWRVEEARAGDDGALLRCSLRTTEHSDVLRQYPFPFVLSVTYVLASNTLRCDAAVQNTGEGRLPMGFGLHPYFRAPLEPEGNRADCMVQVPARYTWKLDAEKLPTGEQVLTPPELETPRWEKESIMRW